MPFGYVLNYAKCKGWTVVPVIDEDHPYSFEFNGTLYILSWRGNRITSITEIKDGQERELTYAQLPEKLKGMI